MFLSAIESFLMHTERLLVGLNKNQIAAVTADGGPIVTMAGAGSGKTQVLTKRIARRVIQKETDPQRVLALTFTNKAAQELRTRIQSLGLRDKILSGTFHAIALAQLKQRWQEKKQPPLRLIDNRKEILSKSISPKYKQHIFNVITEIDWLKAQMISCENYSKVAEATNRVTALSKNQITEIINEYDRYKKRNKIIDFDDVLYLAINDLLNDQTYAAAVRWRHRHFYVDEFQDINPLQYELLTQWRNKREDLFIVGDPNQAIYGWNGADPTLLNEFAEREPNTLIIKLDQNYRSTPEIISAASSVLPPNSNTNELNASKPSGKPIVIDQYGSDQAEAEAIAKTIRTNKSIGFTYSDHAVLARTTSQLHLISQVFEQLDIPCQKWNSPHLIQPELISSIEKHTNKNDNVQSMCGKIKDKLNTLESKDKQRKQLEIILELAQEFLDNTISSDLEEFKKTIILDNKNIGLQSSVALMTFHASKGLEWPVVFIAGMENGLIPITYAKTKEQLDEEDRLLYVAMTRAEEQLNLSWAKRRKFKNKEIRREPSAKLKQLQQTIVLQDVRESLKPTHLDQIREARKQIKTDETDKVKKSYEIRLKTWIKKKAQAARVPDSAILKPELVDQLIILQPKSIESLEYIPGLRSYQIKQYGKDLVEI